MDLVAFDAQSEAAGSQRFARLSPHLRRSRAALMLVFFVLGGMAGAWAARIPAVKGSLHLSAASLGLALLGPAVGLVASTPLSGWALTRVRPRWIMAGGLALYAVSLPFAALAGGALSLFVVLLVWGFGAGMVDVAMNTEGAALQTEVGRPIMAGLHAGYSVGGLGGAASGGLAAALGVSVGVNLVTVGAITAVLGCVAVAALGDSSQRPAAPRQVHGDHGGRTRRLPPLSWGLVALATLAFGGFLAEGATNDWSAVYLHGSLKTSSGFAALGYTMFAVAMVVGRLVGDRLGHWLGEVRLVRVSTSVAAVGFGVALIAGQPVVALVGFAVLGAGLSLVVPLAFSAASRIGTPGPSLALVTGCGYLGLMAGPPLIGGMSELTGLPTALSIVVIVAVATAILAPSLAGDGKGGGYGLRRRSPSPLD